LPAPSRRRHDFTVKTFGALAAAGGITALAVVSGPVTAASASSQSRCPAPRTTDVDRGWGVLEGRFNLKTGPYAGRECGNVTSLRAGTVLYFQCWATNRYGHNWVYSRVKGTRTYGWMSIDNLYDIHDTTWPLCVPGSDRNWR